MEKEMNPVGWFEIPPADLARAEAFFEHVLQIELNPKTNGDTEGNRFACIACINALGMLQNYTALEFFQWSATDLFSKFQALEKFRLLREPLTREVFSFDSCQT